MSQPYNYKITFI